MSGSIMNSSPIIELTKEENNIFIDLAFRATRIPYNNILARLFVNVPSDFFSSYKAQTGIKL
jgi:hypothetical protein